MDLIDLLRDLGALLLVLALLGGAALAARRFGVPGMARPAADRRLRVVETLMLAPRLRLYLVRRDDVEHLILAGPDGTTLVEGAIKDGPRT